MPNNYIDSDYVLARLINSTQTAEGTSMPLRVVGGIRVPLARNLRIGNRSKTSGYTKFTLVWEEPEPNDLISGFRILVVENPLAGKRVSNEHTTNKSPATVTIPNTTVYPVTFTILTILNNGQISLFEDSPSISSRTAI